MTTRDELKDGQKIRVTIEGFVTTDSLGRTFLKDTRAQEYGGRNVAIVPGNDFIAHLEVLEEPKPVWWPPQPGDIVLVEVAEDESSLVRQRDDVGAWHPPCCPTGWSRFGDEDMVTAHLLVRDGTPYQPQWLAP